MKIHWKALLIAPAFIPALFSLGFVLSTSGGNRIAGFLILFAIGAVISYGATLVLLLPALKFAARSRPLDTPRVAIVGAILGTLIFLPLGWIMYNASGPDSGPPVGSFAEYMIGQLTEPLLLSFPIAGLVTATLYWILSGQSANRPE